MIQKKFVLFDLDDTILDFHKAEHIALKKTLSGMGIIPKEEFLKRYSEINQAQWKLLELGETTREDVKLNRYRIFFNELRALGIILPYDGDINECSLHAASDYIEYLSVGHFFLEDSLEVIKKMHNNYHMFIVSNGSSYVQAGRLKSSGIIPYFDDIFISESIGFNKPDIRFFEKCFERIDGFNKKEAVIIGDSLSSDIKGGINAGITTIWLNLNMNNAGNPLIIPDYTISHLNELTQILAPVH